MESKRSEYIRDNYALTRDGDGQWVATSYFRGAVFDEIRGTDRADVCFEARGRWGHFNFEDEARAFDKIFGVEVKVPELKLPRPRRTMLADDLPGSF